MPAIHPTVAFYDCDVNDIGTDYTALLGWIATLSLTHIYGWSVVPVSNSRFRYTIIYD